MSQLPEAWDQGDDWTGVASTAERRKRQNRLHQRAYRKKRHLQRCATTVANDIPESDSTAVERLKAHETTRSQPGLQNASNDRFRFVFMHCPRSHEKAVEFMQSVFANYSLNLPKPSNLPILARLNIINALAINALALNFSFDEMYHDDCISPFNVQGPTPPGAVTVLQSGPDNLRPTALQRTIIHHPWIDLFPIAGMRDNILRGLEARLINEDELCSDMMSVENTDDALAPFVIWGESWDARGWEVSTDFLKKWGWLVQGCPEVLEATNFWRGRRKKMKIDLNYYSGPKKT